ncbi:putative terminase large subunit [Pseudomonas phage PIP]|nr:putative terminase large subunit [Pseudomonas phage PIP]
MLLTRAVLSRHRSSFVLFLCSLYFSTGLGLPVPRLTALSGRSHQERFHCGLLLWRTQRSRVLVVRPVQRFMEDPLGYEFSFGLVLIGCGTSGLGARSVIPWLYCFRGMVRFAASAASGRDLFRRQSGPAPSRGRWQCVHIPPCRNSGFGFVGCTSGSAPFGEYGRVGFTVLGADMVFACSASPFTSAISSGHTACPVGAFNPLGLVR